MIKYIATFVGGGAVGALITWKVVQKYYENLAEEEIQSVRETMNKNIKRDIKNAIDSTDKFGNTVREYGTIMNESEKAKIAYNLVSNKGPLTNEEVDDLRYGYEEDEEMENEALQTIDNMPPYVITGEEFSDEFPHHDKITIQYYVGDDTLCDEAETTIDDIIFYIGEDAYRMLQEESLNTVWVRNERISIDYEIVCLQNSYAEIVLGYSGGSPKERHDKSVAKRKNDEKSGS